MASDKFAVREAEKQAGRDRVNAAAPIDDMNRGSTQLTDSDHTLGENPDQLPNTNNPLVG